MSNDEFDSPDEWRGQSDENHEWFSFKDNVGRLLLIMPTKYETGQVTKFTKPGETQDVVRATIVVLDGPGAGKEYPEDSIWVGRVIGQTKTKIGRKVLGRVTQKPTTMGNPAYELDAGNDADRKTARAWLDRNEFAAPDDSKPPF